MRLLVDEDTQARTLVRLLREAGHDVLTVDEAGLRSLADDEVLTRAIDENRVLLTRNCGDFLVLSSRVREHPGILGIYQDANMAKNLAYPGIVRAIANLEEAGVSLFGEFLSLNAWYW